MSISKDTKLLDLVFGTSPTDLAFINPIAKQRRKELSTSVEAAAIKRDFYCCQFCGFRSEKYQYAVRLRGSKHDLRHIHTACRNCWQVMNLDAAAETRSSVFIWAPEITQLELNRQMPSIYVHRISQGAYGEKAQTLVKALTDRGSLAEKAIGSKDPAVISKEFRQAEVDTSIHRKLYVSISKGLRLFPLDRWINREGALEFNVFPQILAYWRSHNGSLGIAPAQTPEIIDDWLKRLGVPNTKPGS